MFLICDSSGVPKVLVSNIKEAHNFAYCAYCSIVVGKVDDDCVVFEQIPVIPYFHDTLLRNCGLYNSVRAGNHAHYYEIAIRPVTDIVPLKKLVVRVLDSYRSLGIFVHLLMKENC